MNDINSISGSAVQAFARGQQVTAHNLANLNSDDFNAAKVTFHENGGGGVTAYAADTEDAVDISREAANLLTNSQGFQANLKVLKSADEMTRQLLNIKA